MDVGALELTAGILSISKNLDAKKSSPQNMFFMERITTKMNRSCHE